MIVGHRQHSDLMAAHRSLSMTQGMSSVYPMPAQRDGNLQGYGLTYAEHELLRSRKTPHGRIDEQCEAQPLDRNVYVPASKHVLLSASPQEYNSPYRSERQEVLFGDRHGNGGVQRPGWELYGGTDSTLHQTTTMQNYYYHPGSHIPTVLPSALNTQFGPTASAGQQYYGPYWPDGTFSPYRPAPIRDIGFIERPQDAAYIQAESSDGLRLVRRPGRLHLTRLDNDPLIAGPTYLPFSDRVMNGLDSRNKLQYGIQQYERQNFERDPIRSHSSDDKYKNDLRPGLESDKFAFRDRTFSWAYQIYVDLLAKIQRESKLIRPGTHLNGQHKPLNKPSIYPKPPQRQGSHFKEVTHADKISNSKRGVLPQCDEGNLYRHKAVIRSPNRRASEQHVPANNQAMYQNQTSSRHDAHRTIRRVSDPNVGLAGNQPGAVLFEAKCALDTMENFCDEAGEPWTDGMLLAGCLAYGLGDYSRALSWYRKILARDGKHVEAISNLAATLLALGQRDDAQRYWSAAVKLRPSYFEAVEHLIGLLCTTQRARDAVEIIQYVESQLKLAGPGEFGSNDIMSDEESDHQSRSSSSTTFEHGVFDYDTERRVSSSSSNPDQRAPGFGSSGYAIPGADNGRLLALIHAKGNMLYGLGENVAAAASFEDAILVATGHRHRGIQGLIRRILQSCVSTTDQYSSSIFQAESKEPILLSPEMAQQTAQKMFPPYGELPGLEFVAKDLACKAAVSTTSNSLLSLAKIYQDGMSNAATKVDRRTNGTREILALYYLSLSLQRSPSTANNVGILLASVQQSTINPQIPPQFTNNQLINYAGVTPGSGIALALQYYNYGLNIDSKHAHLYTNLGSLLKDLGQLNSAIKMYEIAVQCDGSFDIALANLANAVKDQGRIGDAIKYYRRAVQANPEFAEAVCGLATALNSVCDWVGRGGVYADGGSRDRIHVDINGVMHDARESYGWMNRVVEIVDKQLKDGESWGLGTLAPNVVERLCQQLLVSKLHRPKHEQQQFYDLLRQSFRDWYGKKWEGARIVRLVERAIRQIGWQWYQDRYKLGKDYPARRYTRPTLPVTLSSPTAPTVLPFHTFTTPLSAKQVRQISQRNALRISMAALRSSWLPTTVYPPPAPPSPCLNVGYVSSDFNNHPLAHLMQSIFGLHNTNRVRAFCYATTASDHSVHRQQIEREAPVFYDASTWSIEKLVGRIVADGIHVLVNLNGYTRGARNEVFAARPAPIHMSFMGFAGTLGAEWCDYVFADSISVLPSTLSPWRNNVTIEDRLHASTEDQEDWMYAENVIFAKSTFFCVDHKQSAPDASAGPPPSHELARDTAWNAEQDRRFKLRKELFPQLPDNAVILGNFNQLYKIDPSTFRIYLRILSRVRQAILWLLRFPDVGEQHLRNFARKWAGDEVASRIVFTDVAPKGTHITRASIVDLFLDTPECNAHTTAADVIWSGTPIITWARWDYKMCSRMASSIVASALPEGRVGDEARSQLLVDSDEQYEKQAIKLASGLRYASANHGTTGRGQGKLLDLRRILWEGRWSSRLFDTKRWVQDLETAYWEAWYKWERGEGGDIWL